MPNPTPRPAANYERAMRCARAISALSREQRQQYQDVLIDTLQELHALRLAPIDATNAVLVDRDALQALQARAERLLIDLGLVLSLRS